MKRALLLSFVLAAACTDNKPPVVDAPVASRDVDASAPAPRATAEPSARPEEPAADDPGAKLGLGQRCDPSKPEGPATQWKTQYCSSLGRVAGVYAAGDGTPAPPAGAVVLTQPKDVATTSVSYVAVDERRIWVRRITCAKCARIIGWGFVGDFAELKPEQMKKLQVAIGLKDSDAPMMNAEAWKKFGALPDLTPPR
jgi:hypothetical protein